ncbi:MAG: zinc ribbon domain-containing protein [Deltaproteobacteria bacterium]|nr:MAG: zinc ribbon domain-containing protein [Deltaproteobacteria bacterium]
MPLFEFHCSRCDRTFEKLLRTAKKEYPCPDCKEPAPKAVSIPARTTAGTATSCAAPAGSGFT